MGLRENAKVYQGASNPHRSWITRITDEQKTELADLWEGTLADEYSQTTAWKIWRQAYPDAKVGRSGFCAACIREFGNEPA